jgi:hypothetical protein
MTGPGEHEVVVIGGGQAGLAAGYYLRRAGTDFVILDASNGPGGAWTHAWASLRLFSPARHSSLPGRQMPPSPDDGFPTAAHVVSYLTDYERRYELPIHRPVRVNAVRAGDRLLRVETDKGTWQARHVISATGTWWQPYRPYHPGAFGGRQLHAADYRNPEAFAGQRVVIVGGGNSAAQILADLSPVADTIWVTRRPPRFLPDDIDGRALFETATRRRTALLRGEPDPGGVAGLGDIVMVPTVRTARAAGVLHARPMFTHLTPTGIAWADGTSLDCDAIIWCTGFRPALRHLAPLRLRHARGHIPVTGTRSDAEPRLHLLGYGDWTGPGSATLIGAGTTARDTIATITGHTSRRPGTRVGTSRHPEPR